MTLVMMAAVLVMMIVSMMRVKRIGRMTVMVILIVVRNDKDYGNCDDSDGSCMDDDKYNDGNILLWMIMTLSNKITSSFCFTGVWT